MKFFQRLRAAVGMVLKDGAPFPFNKIMPYDATGGERLYRPYENSVWVSRAIKKISGPVSSVTLDFAKNGKSLEDADQAAWWQNPAVRMSYSDLIEATVGWLKLEGECFWIMDDTWASPLSRLKSPLIVPSPERMHHIIKDGELSGWDYVDGAGNHNVLLPEQVVQIKNWHPYSSWRGLSEFKAAKTAADADYMAGKFNLNLMRSNGDQGVYVICKNGELTDTQRQQVTDQLREKHELAQRGIYKPTFMGGDMSVEDPKIRVPDAAFNAVRLMNRHEIYIAFGVPASMADVQASYSIGSASDWFILIMETVIPTGEKICKAIAEVEARRTGQVVTASMNWDEHPVLQAVRRERSDTAQKYFQMGVPVKILNDYLDLKMPEFPGWEKGYLPMTLQPVEEAGTTPPAGPKADPEDYDDAVALMRRELGPVARIKRALANHNQGRDASPRRPSQQTTNETL